MRVTKKHGQTKVQKQFCLNRDVEAAVEDIAEAQGSSFTRIVTAALIQYLCGNKDSRSHWMSHAMRIETKKSTWDQVRSAEVK